jgi:hypothetical protein
MITLCEKAIKIDQESPIEIHNIKFNGFGDKQPEEVLEIFNLFFNNKAIMKEINMKVTDTHVICDEKAWSKFHMITTNYVTAIEALRRKDDILLFGKVSDDSDTEEFLVKSAK